MAACHCVAVLFCTLMLSALCKNLCPFDVNKYFGYVNDDVPVYQCTTLVDVRNFKHNTAHHLCQYLVNGVVTEKSPRYTSKFDKMLYTNQTLKQMFIDKTYIVDNRLDNHECTMIRIDHDFMAHKKTFCNEKPKSNYVLCSSNYLEHCTPQQNGCKCDAGYVGAFCSFYRDPCKLPNPCQNNGTCIANVTKSEIKTQCICQNDGNWTFEGERCEKRKSLCDINPKGCVNGRCSIGASGLAVCECEPGFYGSLCDKQIDFCKNVYCERGGTCVATKTDFLCRCKEGFGGKICDEIIDKKKLNTKLIIIGAVAGIGILLLVAGCFTFLFLRRKKKRKHLKLKGSSLSIMNSAMSSTMTSTLAVKSAAPSYKSPSTPLSKSNNSKTPVWKK